MASTKAPNWTTIGSLTLGIAGFLLGLTNFFVQLNQVSEKDAIKIENRLTANERDIADNAGDITEYRSQSITFNEAHVIASGKARSDIACLNLRLTAQEGGSPKPNCTADNSLRMR